MRIGPKRGRSTVTAAFVVALAAAGCGGTDAPDATSAIAVTSAETPPASSSTPDSEMTFSAVGDPPVSMSFEITPGPDEGCADFVLAGESQGYLCAGSGSDMSLVTSDVFGADRLTVLQIPADATDIQLSSGAASSRDGQWLIVQLPSDTIAIVKYSIDGQGRGCRIDVLPSACGSYP